MKKIKFLHVMMIIVFLAGCRKEPIDFYQQSTTTEEVNDGCNGTIYVFASTPTPGNSEYARSMVNYYKVETMVEPIKDSGNIKKLATNLVSLFDNPYEKVYAIYHWINFNVDYDWVMWNSGNYSCYNQNSLQVLKRKLGVCEGQSNLFCAMCSRVGITSVKISGKISSTATTGHAWNAVRIENVWYLLDVTWDEVTRQRGINYFLISPTQFYQHHIPDQDLAKWRLFGYSKHPKKRMNPIEFYISTTKKSFASGKNGKAWFLRQELKKLVLIFLTAKERSTQRKIGVASASIALIGLSLAHYNDLG